MSIKFKLGAAVKQIVPVITGTVAAMEIVDGEIHYRVDWADADGEVKSKFFAEEQIEAVVTPDA